MLAHPKMQGKLHWLGTQLVRSLVLMQSFEWAILGPWKCAYSMTDTFTVRFDSNALDSPEYIGPFYSEDDAQDYCDSRNGSLSLSGVPSWVACYSVVDWWWHKLNGMTFTLPSTKCMRKYHWRMSKPALLLVMHLTDWLTLTLATKTDYEQHRHSFCPRTNPRGHSFLRQYYWRWKDFP